MKAKARAAVAAALVAVFVLVPLPARADSSGWWWWLPPSWMDVIAGTAEVALNIWNGVEQPVSGGSESFVSDPVPNYADKFGTNWHGLTFAGLDERGLPLVNTEWAACVPGADDDYYCKNNQSYKVANWFSGVSAVVVFADSYEHSVNWSWDGSLGAYKLGSVVGLSEHGAIVRVYRSTPAPGSGLTNNVALGASWWADASLAVTTTEIVCRSASGDFTVSETSAPGATVAPSPVCPPGSFPVRITVTNSVDGVLSDTSITAPDWYLADPSGVEFGFTLDGTICQPGRPGCDELLENPHFWDPTTNGCYARQRNLDLLTSLNVSYPAAIPGPGDGWIRVPDELCLDRPGSDLPISEPPETPDDPDLGVISRGIDRLIEAVKAAGSSVASGVRGVREEIQKLREDVKSGFDGIGGGDSGPAPGAGEAFNPGEGASLPVPSAEPLVFGSPSGLMGAPAGDGLTGMFEGFGATADAKLGPWKEAVESIAQPFEGAAACSCRQFEWDLPLSGAGSVVLLDTCTGYLSQFTQVSRAASGAVVVIGSGMVSMNFIMSALGFVGLMRERSTVALGDASKGRGKE